MRAFRWDASNELVLDVLDELVDEAKKRLEN